MVTMVWVVGRI